MSKCWSVSEMIRIEMMMIVSSVDLVVMLSVRIMQHVGGMYLLNI